MLYSTLGLSIFNTGQKTGTQPVRLSIRNQCDGVSDQCKAHVHSPSLQAARSLREHMKKKRGRNEDAATAAEEVADMTSN